jgi:hypothetical protein
MLSKAPSEKQKSFVMTFIQSAEPIRKRKTDAMVSSAVEESQRATQIVQYVPRSIYIHCPNKIYKVYEYLEKYTTFRIEKMLN